MTKRMKNCHADPSTFSLNLDQPKDEVIVNDHSQDLANVDNRWHAIALKFDSLWDIDLCDSLGFHVQ